MPFLQKHRRFPEASVFMYHDVRPIDSDFFSKRYRLSFIWSDHTFIRHIKFLKENYKIISLSEFLRFKKNRSFPPNATILTFDDGLADHFNYVLPALKKENLTAVFFITSQSVAEHIVTNVHKIQFILAGAEQEKDVVKDIFDYLKPKDKLKLWEKYSHSRFGSKNEWSPEMVFVTNILRSGHDVEEHADLIDKLFHKYVSVDQKKFAEKFYLNDYQIRKLVECGMEIGGHGHTHINFENCDFKTQNEEIEKNVTFLRKIIGTEGDLFISYPNTGYNQDTLMIMKEKGFKAAFTVGNRKVNVSDAVFELPRLDASKEFRI